MAIRARTDQARIDFINVDLDLCLTLAGVAETAISLHHLDHAEQSISRAEKGYSDLLHFYSEASGMPEDVQKELQSKFSQLRQRLDELRQQLR